MQKSILLHHHQSTTENQYITCKTRCMKHLAVLLLITMFTISSASSQQIKPENAKKIQVAILLDVSGSMDGLIEQAKSQLWNMVTVLGKAQCHGYSPKIEIALYEYGRSTNDEKKGYIKQLSAFTSDLDLLSATLFGLKTDGGDEYCGHVIKTSIDDLSWDMSVGNYKVIFIAGNEDFLQGSIKFTNACALAKQKGIIVNTIYCGDRMQGIKESWNLGGECGNGSYTNINQDAKEEEFNTPYDSIMYVYNSKLNATYIAYGEGGSANMERQEAMDVQNAQLSKKAGLTRAAVKASRGLYDNRSWDLVDAYTSDSTILSKVNSNTLPENLRNKSKQQIKTAVKEKATQRAAIQKEIGRLNDLRNKYITAEKKKRASANASATLETEMERIIRQQAKRYNMIIQ